LGDLGRWVATLVAYGRSLGSNPDISQKYENGRHRLRSGPPKKFTKKNCVYKNKETTYIFIYDLSFLAISIVVILINYQFIMYLSSIFLTLHPQHISQ
jgi:hypothetical protein